jgi:hypothetical protein
MQTIAQLISRKRQVVISPALRQFLDNGGLKQMWQNDRVWRQAGHAVNARRLQHRYQKRGSHLSRRLCNEAEWLCLLTQAKVTDASGKSLTDCHDAACVQLACLRIDARR